ncbi:transcription termination/antitermination NusG family protein [Wenzhouxiangella marina]|uniref:Transcriptional regulator n=1 Tax=Wenzhouxiangella marina TaxID=1579979 RepID=A0A0K0XY51_9GAMM|nr:transcription termination/antitermination NusG family protein [Wenzhouxiangella marina]AKS42613.1 Transcriptional regulator [Wenzhouxiangella marina]MBB6085605.1 transcriptional antiterminator RfaH [Wenzhouxiangella marina]
MIDPTSHHQDRHWHAVFCKPRQDARAEEHLLNQGFEIFRPKTRVRRAQPGRRQVLHESMFPRYLFVRLHRGVDDWSTIRSTRGTVGLVRLGLQAPIVPDQVIESLRQRCDDQGVINLAGAIDYQPNELIEITEGPCAGYRALFQARTGDERVIVLLRLLHQERRVELDENSIRRA